MILLTGFEPFLGETVNPSQELLNLVSERGDVETLLLPVSYQRSLHLLEESLSLRMPQALVMLGQAGGRREICFERVALNFVDSEHADADGRIVHDRKIEPLGPEAYFTSFPIRQWQRDLAADGEPIAVSTSAGTYVCNYLSYQIQHWLKVQKHQSLPCLFIHVPYLLEQLQGKDASVPGLSLEVMNTTLNKILNLISSFVSK